MSRPFRVLLVVGATIAVAALAVACGTEKPNVPNATPQDLRGQVLFAQRCSGCHTLSYAGTHGSAHNVRTAQPNNGPNFDVRCERPAIRVLYAIQNGGFSGAIMPQNVVVAQDAMDVAEFVAKYAGRQAPKVSGLEECGSRPIGVIPPGGATVSAASLGLATTSTTASSAATTTP
jgi:hypothetical protein